jgi:outer membrane protein assembly factor BamB
MKYDSNGDIKWINRYVRTDKNIYAGPMQIDLYGNIYASVNVLNEKLMIMKFDSSGNQKWSQGYPLNSLDFPAGLCLDTLGNFYLASSLYNPNFDFFTIKYSQNFCTEKLIGDIINDCKIDFKDFAALASNWMDCSSLNASDCD